MILRLRLYQLLLKTATYALPILAFKLGWWIWMLLCLALSRPVLYPRQGHFSEIAFGVLVWAVIAEHYRVASFDELFRERTGGRAASAAIIATACVLLATLFFSRNLIFPRMLLVCEVAVLLILTLLLHFVFRVAFRSGASMAKPTRLLVVGADLFARDVALRFQRLSFLRPQVIGHVRLPGQQVNVAGVRVYELEQLGLLTSGHGIDEIAIALPPTHFTQIPEIIRALSHLCLPMHAFVDLGEGIVARQKLFQLGNIQMLDLTSTPTESLDYALLKRAFDVAFSAAVLLLGAPLFALIAAVIKLSSAGPVLFSQERVGLNGKTFKMYKFRTMRLSAESESDTQWTTRADGRRTVFGALLRKMSLDELPQFLNVLRGDMSVVGPRPERPYFVRQFLQDISQYNNRHSLKVGITGWAQVNGWRGDTSIEKRVEYDLYYLQNWSLGFDLRIILQTIFAVVVNKNAY
jgi:Undecaprenyl-phosphate glucose phosphotransferase